MKKKILCLVLAVLMVLPMLVSCGGDSDAIDDVNEEASRYTTTLNMWVITENPVIAQVSKLIVADITPNKTEDKLTDEEKAQINALTTEQRAAWEQLYLINYEINKLTKAKYKTKLNIKYFTEDEYYAAVEKAFDDHEAYIAENKTGLLKNETEETVLNEYGIPELKYPSVLDCEVDILFLNNFEKYSTYAADGLLVELQAQLSESALKLFSYVDNDYLTAGAVNGGVYAIPNNHGVDKYVYVMANKELLENYDAKGELTDATLYDSAFKTYLDYIDRTYDDVYPIYVETDDKTISLDYAHYWSFDLDSAPGYLIQNPDRFSIFGDAYANKTELSNTNLLTDANYMRALATKTHYEKTEGYITNDINDKDNAAVCVVTGGWELKEQYEKEGYEVIVMQYPEMTNDEVFSSMFAIGAYTIDTERSAEIITFLNTNAEVRNLFQYGVLNENYTLKTTTVDGKEYSYAEETVDNLYKMDIEKTGNVFLAYPNSADCVLQWEYQKEQNFEMIKYPTLAMKFSSTYQINEEYVRIMEAVSARMKEYLDGLNSYAEVIELYTRASEIRTDNDMASLIFEDCLDSEVSYAFNGQTYDLSSNKFKKAYTSATVTKIDTSADATQSLYALYRDWGIANGFIIEEDPEE